MEGPPIQLCKTNFDGSPKLPIGVHNPIPYRPSRGHDVMRSVDKETFISVWLSKYVELWKQDIEQNAPYTMKMSMNVDYCICQNLCLFKSPLFWKAFGLLTIRGLIMWRLSCHPQIRLLIWKTWSCVLIVGLITWSQFSHTPYLETSIMEILFSKGFTILSLSLFGWEKHKVMLSRVIKMRISKCWRFSGGFQWRKGQIQMNGVCMKIFRTSGNVI